MCGSVGGFFQKKFTKLGSLIDRKPHAFVVVPLVLVLLSGVALVVRKSAFDGGDPIRWLQRHDERSYDGSYNSTNERFEAVARADETEIGIIYSDDGKNVLTPAGISEYLRLKHQIDDLAVETKDQIHWYKTVCRFEASVCEADKIYTLHTERKNMRLFYPDTQDVKENQSIYIGNTVGGVEVNLASELLGVKAFQRQYRLKSRIASTAWIDRLLSYLKATKYDTIAWWSAKELKTELDDSFVMLYKLMGGSGVSIIVLTLLSFFLLSRSLLGGVGTCLSMGCVLLATTSIYVAITGVFYVGCYPVFFSLAGLFVIVCLPNSHGSWIETGRFSGLRAVPNCAKRPIFNSYDFTFFGWFNRLDMTN